jgi:hypothetical protein
MMVIVARLLLLLQGKPATRLVSKETYYSVKRDLLQPRLLLLLQGKPATRLRTRVGQGSDKVVTELNY